MNLLLRRNGLGLASLRNISSKMETQNRIFRIDLGNRLPEHNYAFNWGNTAINGYSLHNLINKPDAIREISNKGVFRKKLFDAGYAMPTALMRDYSTFNSFPALLRPANHMGGSDIIKVNNIDELNANRNRFGSGAYVSQYINKVAEYRIFVAQGRVVYVVQKIVDDQTAIAWNVHQGGRFVNIGFDNWPLRVVKTSLEAFCLTTLDFGAVDVIVDNDGKVYVLEINSAPAMTAEYWTTCVAKTFDYMITNGHARIPLINERGGYRKFIHPAISPDAQIGTYISGQEPTPPQAPTPPIVRERTVDVTFAPRIRTSITVKLDGTQSSVISNFKTTERARLMEYLRVGGFVE